MYTTGSINYDPRDVFIWAARGSKKKPTPDTLLLILILKSLYGNQVKHKHERWKNSFFGIWSTNPNVLCFFFSFWPRKKCRSLSLFLGRRFTIEVLPNFTLTPHFKSFPPHPKTGFSKAHIASRWIIPWPKYTKKIIFRNKIRLATILGSGAPLFRNRFSGKVSPLA